MEKLPSWFQSKWSNKVQKLQQAEGQNAFPSFSVFVKEVTFHAERMNIPQISQTTPVSGNRRNVTSLSVTPSRGGLQSSKGRDQSSPVTALATHMNPDSEQSSEGNKPVENSTPLASSQSQMTPATPKSAFCPFHRTKSHNLDGCQKFRELDFAKRRDFLFSQPNTPVGTAVSVHLTVKYVETSTLRFSTIHRGQKTRPHPHHWLVLKFATEVLPVHPRGLCY